MNPRAELPFELATLSYAMDYIGIREIGNNAGPAVEFFQRCAQISVGAPWCAAFVNACAELAAVIKNEPSPLEQVQLQGYVPSYVSAGRQLGWTVPFDQVGPGDLFCLWSARMERHAHIGFVDRIDLNADRYSTIEGNTNSQGGREGIEVAARIRRPALKDVFLSWT